MTCGTCKYFGKLVEGSLDRWDDDNDDEVVNTRFHVCDLLKHLNSSYDRIPLTDAAGVIDGSGYHAAFCVTDEFGCNKWEPRS